MATQQWNSLHQCCISWSYLGGTRRFLVLKAPQSGLERNFKAISLTFSWNIDQARSCAQVTSLLWIAHTDVLCFTALMRINFGGKYCVVHNFLWGQVIGRVKVELSSESGDVRYKIVHSLGYTSWVEARSGHNVTTTCSTIGIYFL